MQPRIVIDFDAVDEGDAAALAAFNLPDAGKPADMLRHIQSMRLSLMRLEQQKVQNGGASGNANGGSGTGPPTASGMLDKQTALQAQVRS